jgi:invasion protein IalB
MSTHQSDSSEQRDAEVLIRSKVAEYAGKDLAPSTVTLQSGAKVQVDGADSDESVFVEIFARQGALRAVSVTRSRLTR